MNQRVIISHNLATDLALSMSECEHDRIFVLVDETTKQHCWPVISQFIGLRNATVITIGASDTHKNIDSLMHVWKEARQRHGHTTFAAHQSWWRHGH